MPTPKLTKEMVVAAILGFEEQKRSIDVQIAELRGFLSGEPTEPAPTTAPAKQPRRKVSAAGRKAMAEAQRKRWAAAKGKSEPKASATPASPKPAPKKKRKLSAAGRAAIIAATKKMWAAKRAAAKK